MRGIFGLRALDFAAFEDQPIAGQQCSGSLGVAPAQCGVKGIDGRRGAIVGRTRRASMFSPRRSFVSGDRRCPYERRRDYTNQKRAHSRPRCQFIFNRTNPIAPTG